MGQHCHSGLVEMKMFINDHMNGLNNEFNMASSEGKKLQVILFL